MSRLLILTMLLSPECASAATPVSAVAFRHDGQRVAFGCGDEVRLIQPATRTQDPITYRVSGRVTKLAYDARGRWLAVAHGESGKSGIVTLYPLQKGNGKRELATHKDAIYALAFSPDGKTLATAGYDRLIHLWEIPEPTVPTTTSTPIKPRLTLKDHSDAIYGLAFHPDGALLASVSADRALKVWDVATGKRLYTLADATDWLYSVAWSPDKEHLAAAGVDRSIRIWKADARSGRLTGSCFGHEKAIIKISYSNDGKSLYSMGEDRMVKAWNATTLTESKVYDREPDSILDFALSPDGKLCALARFDGVGVLIDTASGKIVAQLASQKANPERAPAAKPVPPTVTKLVPGGALCGKTTQIIATGTNLSRGTTVTTNRADVKVKVTGQPNATSLTLDVTVSDTAPIGAVRLTFETNGKTSGPATLSIDRFSMRREAASTESAHTAMPVTLPVTLVGTIDRAGDVDYFRFHAKAGEQVGAQIVASELGSKLDTALTFTDDTGKVLAEGSTSLGFLVQQTGTYGLQVHDREFRGGPEFHYRLHVGPVPVITGVFPLAVQRGHTTIVHVAGVNLGSSNVTSKVVVPRDAQPGSQVPVPLNVKAVGAAMVVVSEFPSVVIDPTEGADLRVPGCGDGILTRTHKAQIARFHARKGERLLVEVLAQRAGSPVDPVVDILDAAGKPVPLAVLRCVAKTSVTFRDHDSRGAGIRLDAWNELAIDDYLYVNGEVVRMLALPRGPDDDAQFYQAGGQRLAFLGTSPTHHAFGESMFKVEVHPPGTKFPPNGMPVFQLHYRNDDGGPRYGKDSALFFDPPADGSYQVRVTDARGASGPAHAFRVTVRPPRPDFLASARVVGPQLLQRGSVPVDVKVQRVDGFEDQVNVTLKNLPVGFSASSTVIEAGQQGATLAIIGTPGAHLPAKWKATLIATAKAGGKEVRHEVPLALPAKIAAGDIVTTLRQSAITIQPGKESRFMVDIQRQGKFAGRVPLEVRNLPHGVRVLHVGLNGILITERETSREVVLFAEPWVKPMSRPIVITARREGVGGEFGAKPLMLEVK